jgi:signal transduction histidine kinase
VTRSNNRWLWLFAASRLVATAVAVTLLFMHRLTPYDEILAAVGALYGGLSTLGAVRSSRLQGRLLAWVLDGCVVLGLVLASGEWRSPFYLLALTALVLPATSLRSRRAFVYAIGFTLAYFAVSLGTGIDFVTLDASPRLESLATHLMVPLLVALALSYSADLVERLRLEAERSARLAVEAERRRIAVDLHDSAKQRVHASHLVLSSVRGRLGDERASDGVDQAMGELRAAIADMDSSVSDLGTPLDGRPLHQALRDRAAELGNAGDVRIDVHGEAPDLPTFIAVHAFRVASEAMTNAVRHASASRIEVELDGGPGELTVVVADDGQGMPPERRPASHGLRSMSARAERLGARLEIASPSPAGQGTSVRLEVPLPARA